MHHIYAFTCNFIPAKTFPTELKLVKLFENGMEDKNSLIFQKTAEEILTSVGAWNLFQSAVGIKTI